MKIIGESKDDFIVNISKREVAQMLGYYSEYSDKFSQPKVGDEIKIHAMYRQLIDLYSMSDKLEKIKEGLIEAVGMVELICPVVSQIVKVKVTND